MGFAALRTMRILYLYCFLVRVLLLFSRGLIDNICQMFRAFGVTILYVRDVRWTQRRNGDLSRPRIRDAAELSFDEERTNRGDKHGLLRG